MEEVVEAELGMNSAVVAAAWAVVEVASEVSSSEELEYPHAAEAVVVA